MGLTSSVMHYSINGNAPDAVVVADGDYPTHPIPLRVLQQAPFLCCCDAALENLLAHSITPDAICGDGDSLPLRRKKQFAHLLHRESEQADNDLTKATRYCIGQGYRRIAYLGATGGREDHTLGNISLMAQYATEFGIQPVMYTDHGYIVPVIGRATLPTFPRQQVSIFNFGCSNIDSDGLLWPTRSFDMWWQGTLNEALTDHITLCATGGSCLVFLTYAPKTDGRH